MIAADRPRPRGEARLMVVDPTTGAIGHRWISDLPSLLRAGDRLVVNDAGTLPASLPGRLGDAPVELRLAGRLGGELWQATLFGAGDWRTPTEQRPAPPAVRPGDVIAVDGFEVEVEVVHRPRWLTVRVPVDWPALLRAGRPVQYSYLGRDVGLGEVQTAVAGPPWAVEMPSAARPLSWGILLAAKRRGIGLSAIRHAAGLSATADPALDAELPFPERFRIPERAATEIAATRARGGRIVAVGTTVARALEGAVHRWGHLRAGMGTTGLRLDATVRPRVVDGLLSGMHGPGESHFDALSAFAPADLLARAHAEADRAGYLAHEFGDATLVLPADVVATRDPPYHPVAPPERA